ncbi:MAG: hydrogenase maturation protease [Candidatus Aminicenantes bacterium]|nr:hydrogenase maturation protease [Candidatus Aminicenantes bacterium]
MKTLVLGLGNDLYGDDGVGPCVVRRINCDPDVRKEMAFCSENVHFEECAISGLGLLDVIIGYDRLILIDTIKKAEPTPGKVTILKESDLRHIPGPSPHYVSVPQAIEIGRRIGVQVPGRIDIIAVEAKNMYNLGEGLTDEMTRAIPKIIRELRNLLEQ